MAQSFLDFVLFKEKGQRGQLTTEDEKATADKN